MTLTKNGKNVTAMANNTALLQGREQAIRFNHPEWTDEQVQERMKELAEYCEHKEKEWSNPLLIKIWTTEKKFRKR